VSIVANWPITGVEGYYPREHIDWQNHRLMIYGKDGIYGTKSKRRIIALTDRIRPLIDGHFAIHDTIGMTPRTIQRILKRLANKARINRPVSPHVLRHYLPFLTMSCTISKVWIFQHTR
jgi:integrase/recombinase XerD